MLAWYWLPPLLLFFMASMRRHGLLVVAFVIYSIPLGIFALVATISFARRVGIGWAAGAAITAFLPCVILAGAAERAQRLKYAASRPADPMSLTTDLLALHTCNQDFSRAHPDKGYAQSLDQLGPQGTQCLSASLTGGASDKFTIQYEPGARSADGVVEKYSVKAW